MTDNEQISRLIKALSAQTGRPESELLSALNSGDPGSLAAGLDPEQARQFHSLINDEDSARRFLASPAAKAILKRLLG